MPGVIFGEIREALPELYYNRHCRKAALGAAVVFLILAASVALYVLLAHRLTGAQGQETLLF